MKEWTEIRQKALVQKVSKREILGKPGMHWQTLEKILAHSQPQG